jgi:hypothetical protein
VDQTVLPAILGLIFIVIGGLSFFGRHKLSRFGARASVAVNQDADYDRAYNRRLRYGVVSGLIFLSVGTGFLVYGIIRILGMLG